MQSGSGCRLWEGRIGWSRRWCPVPWLKKITTPPETLQTPHVCSTISIYCYSLTWVLWTPMWTESVQWRAVEDYTTDMCTVWGLGMIFSLSLSRGNYNLFLYLWFSRGKSFQLCWGNYFSLSLFLSHTQTRSLILVSLTDRGGLCSRPGLADWFWHFPRLFISSSPEYECVQMSPWDLG